MSETLKPQPSPVCGRNVTVAGTVILETRGVLKNWVDFFFSCLYEHVENIPLATTAVPVMWVPSKMSPFSLMTSEKQQYFMLAPPYPKYIIVITFSHFLFFSLTFWYGGNSQVSCEIQFTHSTLWFTITAVFCISWWQAHESTWIK